MEVLAPEGVLGHQVGKEGVGGVLFDVFLVGTRPKEIGKERLPFFPFVEFHHVHLAVVRPGHRATGAPDGRPGGLTDRNPCPKLDDAVQEILEPLGDEGCGGIVDVAARGLPRGTSLDIVRVFLVLDFGFHNQASIFTAGVFRLVPLDFQVADEALFVGPFCRVRHAGGIELIGPIQHVIAVIGRADGILPRIRILLVASRQQQGQGQQQEELILSFHRFPG